MAEQRALTDDRLEVIRGLLAKAEATEFHAEAASFRAKASELMARYAVDDARVWADAPRDRRDHPTTLDLVLHRPYVAQQAVLVNEVATACGCRAVRFVEPGRPTERVEVVGFPADLRLVDTMVTSLLVQMARAMTEGPGPETPRPAGAARRAGATAAWRRSFMVGFIDEVATRLAADRRAAAGEPTNPGRGAERDPTSSVAVALRDREAVVDAELRRRHPRLRHARVGGGSSGAGRSAGAAAGRRADLSRARLGARPALGAGPGGRDG